MSLPLASRPLRLLFVKDKFHWPRASGGDIHGSQMARALAARGHEVDVATFAESDEKAVSGLGLRRILHLNEPVTTTAGIAEPGRLQRKFDRYLGQDPKQLQRLAAVVQAGDYDAVVVLGVISLPLLRAVQGPLRVWYAADDAALLHWSMFRLWQRSTWKHLKLAAIQGLYERCYKKSVDLAWVVSKRDQTAMRRIAGYPRIDIIANGVDADFFAPVPATELPSSCVFWGRLDFGPNEDAVDWFVKKVWPLVLQREPSAQFTVMGFHPTGRVRRTCQTDGVELLADVPDLRKAVCERAVAAMPFVSGVGIKNKVLEAAALGRAMVCTPDATSGMRGVFPATVAGTPAQFAESLLNLFANPARRAEMGRSSREWVLREHSWDAAAAIAETGFYERLSRRPTSQMSYLTGV